SDPDGDPLVLSLASDPAHGTLLFTADGSVRYTPDAGYHGPDSFTYRAYDGALGGNLATVSINVVAPTVTPPTAGDDRLATAQNATLHVGAPGVLGNDTPGSIAVLVSKPAHGTLGFAASGSFTYIPDDNYRGPDSFTYRDVAGGVSGNVATVHLTI